MAGLIALPSSAISPGVFSGSFPQPLEKSCSVFAQEKSSGVFLGLGCFWATFTISHKIKGISATHRARPSLQRKKPKPKHHLWTAIFLWWWPGRTYNAGGSWYMVFNDELERGRVQNDGVPFVRERNQRSILDKNLMLLWMAHNASNTWRTIEKTCNPSSTSKITMSAARIYPDISFSSNFEALGFWHCDVQQSLQPTVHHSFSTEDERDTWTRGQLYCDHLNSAWWIQDMMIWLKSYQWCYWQDPHACRAHSMVHFNEMTRARQATPEDGRLNCHKLDSAMWRSNDTASSKNQQRACRIASAAFGYIHSRIGRISQRCNPIDATEAVTDMIVSSFNLPHDSNSRNKRDDRDCYYPTQKYLHGWVD